MLPDPRSVQWHVAPGDGPPLSSSGGAAHGQSVASVRFGSVNIGCSAEVFRDVSAIHVAELDAHR